MGVFSKNGVATLSVAVGAQGAFGTQAEPASYYEKIGTNISQPRLGA